MSRIANIITNLLDEGGKTAPEMTHALKKVGGGDMQKGIVTITRYVEKKGLKEGIEIGTKAGFKSGAIKFGTIGIVTGTLIGLGVSAYYNSSKRKTRRKEDDIDEEGCNIVNTLKEGFEEYELTPSKKSDEICDDTIASEAG